MPSPPSSQITWDDVVAVAPELASATITSATGRSAILAYVNTWNSGSTLVAWDCDWDTTIGTPGNGIGGGDDGPLLRLLRMHLAAHFATMARRAASGAAGPVTSEAAGGLRRSYGLSVVAFGDPGLSLTLYGQTAMTLMRLSLAHGPVLC